MSNREVPLMIFCECACLRSCFKKLIIRQLLLVFLLNNINLCAVAEVAMDGETLPALSISESDKTGKMGNFQKILKSFEQENGDYDLFSQFRKYPTPRNKILLNSKVTELAYGGCIKSDYYGARHAINLDKSRKDDDIDQFRERAEIMFEVSHKMDPYRDRPVLVGRVSIGNVMFWRTHYAAKDVSVAQSFVDLFGLIQPSVRANLQEAWLQVNVDQVFSNHEPIGLSVKCGYFPFIVGRGVSLGDWFNGGSLAFGFSKAGVQEIAPKFAPGILATGTLYNNCLHYDLYFSPAVTEEVTSVGQSPYYMPSLLDSASDRHILAGRIRGYYGFYDNSKSYIEPYFVYYNSPRNSARAVYDSPLRFLTFGCMLDHKVGGFEINAEFAQQVGRQKIRERLNDNRPDYNKFLTVDANGNRIFNPALAPNFFQPYTGDMTDNSFNASQNYVNADGNLATLTSDAYLPLPKSYDAWVSDQNKSFLEYHHPYEIDLAGRMCMVDVRYTFDDYPLQVAAAFGYFSGDVYPYNDAVDKYFCAYADSEKPSGNQPIDKRYNFLPLRDYHYTGLWAFPMVALSSGLLPRPYGLNYSTKSSVAERDACTNLIFGVVGFTVSPTDDLQRFRINPNVCVYWNNADTKKWNKDAVLPPFIQMEEDYLFNAAPILNEESAKIKNPGNVKSLDTARAYQKLQGWESNSLASSNLGWEINCLVNYYITDNLDLMIKAGMFFPGQLYRDLAGQPNDGSVVAVTTINPNGTVTSIAKKLGLGYDPTYGINIRIGYTF